MQEVVEAETFELVDGDKVADVVFSAGSYTLAQIAERVNGESKTVIARVTGGKIAIKVRDGVLKGRAIGFSHHHAFEELARLEAQGLQKKPRYAENRHERRKAAAQARRRT